jgi:hypothetical protein
MKPNLLFILITALALSPVMNTANAEHGDKPEASVEKIAEFRKSKDDMLLFQQLQLLKKEAASSSQASKLLCRILVEADLFLSGHERPKGTPSLNIAPPNGGRSGVAPASISDPVERAGYQKLIDENKKLVEAHRKHAAVTRIKDSALDMIANYQANGLIKESQIEAAIQSEGASEEQKTSLKKQIKTATTNAMQRIKGGTVAPGK